MNSLAFFLIVYVGVISVIASLAGLGLLSQNRKKANQLRKCVCGKYSRSYQATLRGLAFQAQSGNSFMPRCPHCQKSYPVSSTNENWSWINKEPYCRPLSIIGYFRFLNAKQKALKLIEEAKAIDAFKHYHGLNETEKPKVYAEWDLEAITLIARERFNLPSTYRCIRCQQTWSEDNEELLLIDVESTQTKKRHRFGLTIKNKQLL